MNEYKLCAALGRLPEDMIAAAMDAGADSRRKRRFQTLTVLRRVTSGVVAAAIVLAMLFGLPVPGGDQIVTAPGVLVVKAYADGLDAEGVVLETGKIDITTARQRPSFNQKIQMPLSLSIDIDNAENVTIQIWTETGVLNAGDYSTEDGRQISLANGETLQWSGQWENKNNYLKVIVYDGTRIAGYAVIQVFCMIDLWFFPMLIESVCYPAVDGQHQEISMEYVQEQIESAIDNPAIQYPNRINKELTDSMEWYMEKWESIMNDPMRYMSVRKRARGYYESWLDVLEKAEIQP